MCAGVAAMTTVAHNNNILPIPKPTSLLFLIRRMVEKKNDKEMWLKSTQGFTNLQKKYITVVHIGLCPNSHCMQRCTLKNKVQGKLRSPQLLLALGLFLFSPPLFAMVRASACDQRSNVDRPLFWVLIFFLSPFSIP
jgi:hypothetical protein